MSYQIVDGKVIKVGRRTYDPSKPGLVHLLRSEFPRGQEGAALSYASQLAAGNAAADWDRNDEIARGVTVGFVVSAIRDMVEDRQTDARTVESGKLTKENMLFAKAVQDAATSRLTNEDRAALALYANGQTGILDGKTGALRVR